MPSLISMLHHKVLVIDSNWNHFFEKLFEEKAIEIEE